MREPPEKWGRAFILTAAVLFLGWSGLAPAMGAASPSTQIVNIETARPADAYIAGYAMAIILREFNLKGVTLTVEGGNVILITGGHRGDAIRRVAAAVFKLPSVRSVSIRERLALGPKPKGRPEPDRISWSRPIKRGKFTIHLREDVSGAAALALKILSSPGADSRDRIYRIAKKKLSGIDGLTLVAVEESIFTRDSGTASAPPEEEPKKVVRVKSPDTGSRFFPKGDLFKPLIADPRWPHFSVVYQSYIDDQVRSVENKFVSTAIAVSFGETLPIYRQQLSPDFAWEIGFHAAVFGLFDLEGESFDLINTDFWVAPIAIGIRLGNITSLFRFYHQSSHLGDEFILRDPNISEFALRDPAKDRVNLSYWAFNLLLSYDIDENFRVYVGGEHMIDKGGFFFEKDPSDLEEVSVQYGIEYRGLPLSILKWDKLEGRIITGMDIKNQEESDWEANLSIRGGLQFEDPNFPHSQYQIILEYFTGRSPNGQFYKRNIEYFGFGVQGFF